jgi:hypothetical protein
MVKDPPVLMDVVKLAATEATTPVLAFPLVGESWTVPVRGVPFAKKVTVPVGATP